MTDREERLSKLRLRLYAERDRLTKELERREQELESGTYTEDRGYGTHLADDASGTEQEETDLTLERNIHKTLDAVMQALHRFENGTYGICDDCSRSIDLERLEAIPWATLCLEDRAKREKATRFGHSAY